ncbi:hypothetical protein NDU88_002638 [Pleurodeles waltl]|uniref:Uncharacterized protein n=1 Tax=Pleurodeles waltl TaxID=8319 RepID=A0AAV7W2Q2_PLEWA|nr:hypothetical protein NDU88_002638 [Pleurodeles waltl]
MMESLQGDQEHQGQSVRQRKKKPPKPSQKESKKEREDLLQILDETAIVSYLDEIPLPQVPNTLASE